MTKNPAKAGFFVFPVTRHVSRFFITLYIYFAMNSPEIKAFIRQNSSLFWYTPEDKKEDISLEFLVETILNYGDLRAVKQLFELMGIKKISEIFFYSINLSDRRKGNFHELTINYFTLLFKRYASGDI